MTYRAKYYKCTTWQNRVIVMNMYHQLMQYKTGGRQTVRKTAKYFAISIGSVSENLRLADNFEKVKFFPYRKDALRSIK